MYKRYYITNVVVCLTVWHSQNDDCLPKYTSHLLFHTTLVGKWNSLPLNIRELISLKAFTNAILPDKNISNAKKLPSPYFSFGDRTENIIHTCTNFATTACWLMTFLDIVLLKDLYMSVKKLIEDTYHYFFSCTKSKIF